MEKKASYANVPLRVMWPWVAEGWPCLAWAACGPGPLTSLRSRPGSQTRWVSSPVMRIHEILVRIRISGSIPLTSGSGCGSGSCYFRQWPSRRQQKIIFFSLSFLLVTFWRYIYIIFLRFIKKSQGSGSVSLTNRSGSGRPKNIWILRIRIRKTAPPPPSPQPPLRHTDWYLWHNALLSFWQRTPHQKRLHLFTLNAVTGFLKFKSWE